MRDRLDLLRKELEKLPPGMHFGVDRDLLLGILVPPPWTASEWVLEGITGSAFEFSIIDTPESGNVVFRRLSEPLKSASGLRAYVSADRRHLFTRRPDFLYEPKLGSLAS
jgi:hypothetical protein